MNKKIASEIAIGIILSIALAIGGIFWWQNKKATSDMRHETGNGQAACTMEAKICDDGSYVGRTGPSCEFAPCPENKSAQMANPASVYCEQNGGKLEIRTASDGGQAGYCKFDNGVICEEWAFMRRECGEFSSDIKDWKTYKNNEYNFSFNYPAQKATIKIRNEKDGMGITLEPTNKEDEISSDLALLHIFFYKDTKENLMEYEGTEKIISDNGSEWRCNFSGTIEKEVFEHYCILRVAEKYSIVYYYYKKDLDRWNKDDFKRLIKSIQF